MAVEKLILMRSESVNVFVNQAVEAALLESVGEDEAALYLWRNERTVVVGRNQNAFSECRVEALESDGGLLARRLSGGGAVWHDGGNLNFTFLSKAVNFDKEKNFDIVVSALSALGIDAVRSGRNDLTVCGTKFGGNAYYRRGDAEMHHGTVMVSTRPEDVSRYLTPPKEKFSGKGVGSVYSRVAPLDECAGGLSVKDVADALEESFVKAYAGAEVRRPLPFTLGAEKVLRWTGFFGADEWRYGTKREYAAEFPVCVFGRRAVCRVATESGAVVAVDIDSDSLDADMIAALNCVAAGQPVPAGLVLSDAEREEVYAEAERLSARIKEECGV